MGNKIDKISSQQLIELQTACPQQVLTSAIATDLTTLFKKFEEFFIEVLEDRLSSMSVGSSYHVQHVNSFSRNLGISHERQVHDDEQFLKGKSNNV